MKAAVRSSSSRKSVCNCSFTTGAEESQEAKYKKPSVLGADTPPAVQQTHRKGGATPPPFLTGLQEGRRPESTMSWILFPNTLRRSTLLRAADAMQ